jgi:hypothetical protein
VISWANEAPLAGLTVSGDIAEGSGTSGIDRAHGRSHIGACVIFAFIILACTFSARAQAAPALSFTNFSSGAIDSTLAPETQAGAHPAELVTTFSLGTVIDSRTGVEAPGAPIKNVAVEIPPGMLGDPAAIPQCSQADMNGSNPGRQFAECPANTQVGYAEIKITFIGPPRIFVSPIFNMAPPRDVTAQFAFLIQAGITHINLGVRSNGDYGVTATSENINTGVPVYGATIHLWGIPGDSSHNLFRSLGGGQIGPGVSVLPRTPFLRNPTSCTGPTKTTIHATSWSEPGVDVEASSVTPETTGCASVPFAPSLAVSPDTQLSGSSGGYAIVVDLPQNELPDGLATSDVKKVVTTLPNGVTINPSSAAGLGGCTDAEFAMASTEDNECPFSSKIGEVEIDTPLLSKPLSGSLFLAAPLEQNAAGAASGRMYRLFLQAEGSAVRIKLLGTVVPDPTTGQLTATFDDTPQQPFETLHVQLMGGALAPLTTPRGCGTYKTSAQLTPWARPTEPVTVDSSFTINEGCDNAGKFGPTFEAGTTNPVAGASSPFTLRVTAPSGQQNLVSIQATLPAGVLAKLKGVGLCPDASAATGNCPASSQVGTTIVGAGNGSSPIYVPQPGKSPTAVYLAGPYMGAPYSLVVKVPAEAGPFNLGTVAVRNGLYVDPTTAQVTAKSDPLPQILLGVPITYRDIRVEINRPDFTINPTNCEPKQVTSVLTSIAGTATTPSDRFQVANCEGLGFKPTLALSFKGQTKRSGNPALTAVLKAPEGQANIAKTNVLLPSSVFIDNRHISNPCTRVQFAADACPAKSILGTAVAYTPLLEKPLEGPVYFRSNGGERNLPDLVADLNGQIHITLVGFIDSVKTGKESSRVRTRFQSVPDAPVSKFELKLYGGKKGLIQNSTNICKDLGKAIVQMTGQNGKPNNFETTIATGCGKKKQKHSKRRGRR